MEDLKIIAREAKQLASTGKCRAEIFKILNQKVLNNEYKGLNSHAAANAASRVVTWSIKKRFGAFQYTLLALSLLYFGMHLLAFSGNSILITQTIIDDVLFPGISVMYMLFLALWNIRFYTTIMILEGLAIIRDIIIIIFIQLNYHPDTTFLEVMTVFTLLSGAIFGLAVYLHAKLGSGPTEVKEWVVDSSGKRRIILRYTFPEDPGYEKDSDIIDTRF